MNEIQKAFVEWVNTRAKFGHVVKARNIEIITRFGDKKAILEPDHFDGECCNRSHVAPDPSDRKIFLPKPDSEVCERERTWRKYIRLRDALEEIKPLIM